MNKTSFTRSSNYVWTTSSTQDSLIRGTKMVKAIIMIRKQVVFTMVVGPMAFNMDMVSNFSDLKAS